MPVKIKMATEASNSSELPSLQVEPLPASNVPSPDPLAILHDFDSGSLPSDDLSDSDQWGELDEEAESLFTEEEIEEMIRDLKEIGMLAWVNKYHLDQKISFRHLLLVLGVLIPSSEGDIPEDILLKILKAAISRVLRRRDKLESFNTPDDVVQLIRNAKHIIVLTGAGVSTSCGIPDFRSADGIYSRIQQERQYELSDPQEMFDIDVFRNDPTIFYSFARELYPSNFIPSPSHRFIKLLEDKGKLLRNYTQNIDTLEHQAGVKNVLNCHGSFARAACVVCGHQVSGEDIKDDIFACRVPLCKVCTTEPKSIQTADDLLTSIQLQASEIGLPPIPPTAAEAPKPQKPKVPKFSNKWDEDEDESEDDLDGYRSEWLDKPIMKPTITFFGEKLADEFDKSLLRDRDQVDLLLVLGTSLKVAPVSEILGHIPHSVPQVLINRDPVSHANFDVCLLGNCDSIVRWLCDRLLEFEPSAVPLWSLDAILPSTTTEKEIPPDNEPPRRLGDSHIHFFTGANTDHRWLSQFDPNVLTLQRSRSRSRPTEGGLSIPDSDRVTRSMSRSRSTTPQLPTSTSDGTAEEEVDDVEPPLKKPRIEVEEV